jgi:hypothetical protein
MTVWPSYDGPKNPATGLDDVITEYMIRKNNGFAFRGLRYKVHEATQKISALQILYNPGYCSPVAKAKYETCDDMTEVLIPTGRRIGSFIET